MVTFHYPGKEKKQGLAIFLSLEGKAREAVLELEVEQLNDDNGVAKVLAQLDKLYLKDKLQLSFQAYDAFRKFKRPSDMPIAISLLSSNVCIIKLKLMIWFFQMVF